MDLRVRSSSVSEGVVPNLGFSSGMWNGFDLCHNNIQSHFFLSTTMNFYIFVFIRVHECHLCNLLIEVACR